MEAEFAMTERTLQSIHELATKNPAEHLPGQEELLPGPDPAGVVWGQTTGWDDAVHVGMSLQVLSPSVQHRQETDLGSQMFGVSSNLQQRLGTGAHEQVVNHCLVL